MQPLAGNHLPFRARVPRRCPLLRRWFRLGICCTALLLLTTAQAQEETAPADAAEPELTCIGSRKGAVVCRDDFGVRHFGEGGPRDFIHYGPDGTLGIRTNDGRTAHIVRGRDGQRYVIYE
ncbi:MAG: hypothetical protein H6978_08580 [Gammaproteobacteria bacterium]|nr:hypothetical protein [Gammaproteobacteria bacterium]